MRQKNFNFYEEAIRVPLVYSNPRLFEKPETQPRPRLPRRLPADAREPRRRATRRPRRPGRASTTPIRSSSRSPTPPPQDYTVFTYDDFQSGQSRGPYPRPPNHIASIRERRWKLARYYDVNGKRARRVGDVRPEDRSARAHEPRVQALQAHTRSRSASTGGFGASSPASRRRACSRFPEGVTPARNRVTPMGEIEAFPLRGAWTGNRGILHRGREIVRFHASDLWITCALRVPRTVAGAVAAASLHLAVLPRRGGFLRGGTPSLCGVPARELQRLPFGLGRGARGRRAVGEGDQPPAARRAHLPRDAPPSPSRPALGRAARRCLRPDRRVPGRRAG